MKMERTDDIAQEILRNREKGTGRLVAEHKDRLYAVALALCRNPTEAEDLTVQMQVGVEHSALLERRRPLPRLPRTRGIHHWCREE